MEVVARELIPALLAAAPEMRFTAFVNREAAAAGDGPWGELLPAVTVPVNARRREQWALGEQTLLPALAARAGVDLVHSLASTAPAWGPFRRVVTVHDLIYARFPDAHSGLRDRGMRVLVPLAVRRSHRVIADSQSTRRDLIELLGAPSQRIDVAPLGFGVPPPRAAARRGPHASALRPGRPARGSQSFRQASPQEPARTDRRFGAHPGRAPAAAGAARLPHLARGRAARARRRARRVGGRPLRGLGHRGGARGPVGARGRVRLSLALRGIRPARARGDDTRRSGRLRKRLLAARGRRRRGAAVRSPRRRRDRLPRSSACSGIPRSRRSSVRQGLARAREFTWERTAPHARQLRRALGARASLPS